MATNVHFPDRDAFENTLEWIIQKKKNYLGARKGFKHVKKLIRLANFLSWSPEVKVLHGLVSTLSPHKISLKHPWTSTLVQVVLDPNRKHGADLLYCTTLGSGTVLLAWPHWLGSLSNSRGLKVTHSAFQLPCLKNKMEGIYLLVWCTSCHKIDIRTLYCEYLQLQALILLYLPSTWLVRSKQTMTSICRHHLTDLRFDLKSSVWILTWNLCNNQSLLFHRPVK